MQITKKTVAHCYTNHSPNQRQQDSFDLINRDARLFSETLLDRCPPSRELSLALTAVQEARMWANLSVAVNPAAEKTPAQEAASRLQDPRSGGGKALIDLSDEPNPGDPFIREHRPRLPRGQQGVLHGPG